MARLYANENFPLPVVESLRQYGHDVLTVAETGRSQQAWPDEDVLNFAIQDNRTLLTLNRKHFIRLHTLNAAHTGIVTCTFDADFTRQAVEIDEAIRAVGDLRGRLLRVNRPSGP
jgi:hypothetical protein